MKYNKPSVMLYCEATHIVKQPIELSFLMVSVQENHENL